jgi:hypothetical protein
VSEGEYLYKFRPLFSKYEIDNNRDINFNKNTFKLLIDGELHFSSPLDFNDPFDSLINIEKKCEALSGEISIEARLNKKKNNVTWSDLGDITCNDLPNESWGNLIHSYSVSDLRIFCASKSFSNILLWSHYADMHRGICIGFDLINKSLKYKEKEYDFIKVKYGNNFIFKNDNEKSIANSLLCKTLDWKYENEYRLILDNKIIINDKKNIDIELSYIKEIIFGVLTPIKYIQALVNKMYESTHKKRIENLELKFYQMKRDIGSFKINKEELDYKKYINI